MGGPAAQPSSRAFPWLLAGIALAAPFSIDGTLPAMAAIGEDLGVGDAVVQQTLTVFLVAFAVAMLVHGALADTWGRRRVLFTASLAFAAASCLCVVANDVTTLMVGRLLQGLTAGAGIIVGRAVIRDRFEGDEARRVQSLVMLVFALAPAIAPLLSGWLVVRGGWRAAFWLLVALGLAAAWLAWRHLPETLPPERRRAARVSVLWQGYVGVFGAGRFWRVAGTLALLQAGAFVYIASAARVIVDHLGRGPDAFAWLTLPQVVGTMAGGWASAVLARRTSPMRLIAVAIGVVGAACALNLGMTLAGVRSLPWLFVPLGVYTLGVALVNPTLQMLLLQQFADRAGTASSCLGFVQTGGFALTAGVIAPLAYGSLAGIAFAQFALASAAFVIFATRVRSHLAGRR